MFRSKDEVWARCQEMARRPVPKFELKHLWHIVYGYRIRGQDGKDLIDMEITVVDFEALRIDDRAIATDKFYKYPGRLGVRSMNPPRWMFIADNGSVYDIAEEDIELECGRVTEETDDA